jgi:hypothetical protein
MYQLKFKSFNQIKVKITYYMLFYFQLFSSPNRIVDFAGPILVEDSKMCQQSDMALTRLLVFK